MNNALKIGVGVAAGFALGYAACKRQLQQSYMDLADSEIADMKAHYEKRLQDEGDRAVKEYEAWLAEAEEKDEPEESIRHLTVADAMTPIIPPLGDEEAVYHDSQPYDETPLVAAAATAMTNYNQISTQHARPPKPATRETKVNEEEQPILISEETFMADELGFEQLTLTYYIGDNVLTTDDDKEVAGNERLWAVGTLIESYIPPAGSSNVMYIRSPKLQQEYEIVRMEGSYSQIVLGTGDESPQPAS